MSDSQAFNFAGPYGDNGWLEDYTARVGGEPIGCAVWSPRNAARQTHHIAANYRPLTAVVPAGGREARRHPLCEVLRWRRVLNEADTARVKARPVAVVLLPDRKQEATPDRWPPSPPGHIRHSLPTRSTAASQQYRKVRADKHESGCHAPHDGSPASRQVRVRQPGGRALSAARAIPVSGRSGRDTCAAIEAGRGILVAWRVSHAA